ncbi:hypothetical protein [Deminuibacter soli]|uniref:Uncharacterized protein n=1 Tax=Deminuibacter soli TaxID=2291815 RepID=A0A3E1NJJ9_9BACT|nr:hypothetical protein [Deminuibacter soli]RFM28110.1 hypothetical protein DXN05_11310 [Deminuibacter soli]
MELDDLKYHLQQQAPAPGEQRSADDIAALLKPRARSVVDKLKLSLWFELLCSVIFLIVAIVVMCTAESRPTRIYFGVFGITSLLFCLLLGFLLYRVISLSSTPLPVKKNLETIYYIIHHFSRRYNQFTSLLLPLCVALLYGLIYQDMVTNGIEPISLAEQWPLLLQLLGYCIGGALIIYFIRTWYFRKLYFNYLKQLRECIRELATAS